MLVGRRCLCLFSSPAVQAFNHHEHRSFRHAGVLRGFGKVYRSGSADFDNENSFATLNSIAVIQERIPDAVAVEKRSVSRAEIAQVRMRRVHLEQAMIAREVTILRQTQ